MSYEDELMHRLIVGLKAGLRPYKRPEPKEKHLFKRLHDDKPEGPFVCCCGFVAWDAETGLHHLTEKS